MALQELGSDDFAAQVEKTKGVIEKAKE